MKGGAIRGLRGGIGALVHGAAAECRQIDAGARCQCNYDIVVGVMCGGPPMTGSAADHQRAYHHPPSLARQRPWRR